MDSLDAEDVKFDILEVSLRDIVSFVMKIILKKYLIHFSRQKTREVDLGCRL